MKTLKQSSTIKTLSKKEQKAIVGGMCREGGYPIYCASLRRRVCPDVCPD
jgi:hypothetical protein